MFIHYGYVCTFSAHGNLYGEVGVVNASLSAVTSEGVITRFLSYTLVRRGGGASSIVIVIQHSYNQVDTSKLLANVVLPVTIGC